MEAMNGAQNLIRTLVSGGVDVCFANPGTSEMHFVAALDRVPEMRCVLALFEGVATGAADGYARMMDRPASTLLHLGPGFSNGMANLHNASRANSPIVNIVGDHATYHRAYDSPLTSDVEAIARPYSSWLKTSKSAADISDDAAAAIAAARTAPGRIATLILPANIAWSEAGNIARVPADTPRARVADAPVVRAAELLQSGPAAIILAGPALREASLATAGRIAARTGAKIYAPYGMARAHRGAGRVPVERIPFMLDAALAMFANLRAVVLVGATAPVAFFAYPERPSSLTPDDCVVHVLSDPAQDGVAALEALADRLDARTAVPVFAPVLVPQPQSGPITLAGIAAVVAAAIPENGIVVDEAQTSGRSIMPASVGSPQHDYICNTGGSIGYAMPVAVGAAIACPDRPVMCLEADGSGMYTLQALWTIARERLNVTTVIMANRKYQVLIGESKNVGAGGVDTLGPRALDMLHIGRPDLDWVALGKGMGVPGQRVTTLEAFATALQQAMRDAGPALIEVVVP